MRVGTGRYGERKCAPLKKESRKMVKVYGLWYDEINGRVIG